MFSPHGITFVLGSFTVSSENLKAITFANDAGQNLNSMLNTHATHTKVAVTDGEGNDQTYVLVGMNYEHEVIDWDKAFGFANRFFGLGAARSDGVVVMTAKNAHLLKDHFQNHPEFTGADGAEDKWNKHDLCHFDLTHGEVPAQLVQELKSLTSITGASWTGENREYHTQEFTGPRRFFRELTSFCSQFNSSSDSPLTIKGWKRQYKVASNKLI